MRKLIVAASLVLTMTLASVLRADEPVAGAGARGFAAQGAKSSAADADIPTTEIKTTMTRAASTSGLAGLKTTNSANKLTPISGLAPQSRISNLRRVAPVRTARAITSPTQRETPTVDVQPTHITRTLAAAPRNAVANKRLATQTGPTLQAIGHNFSLNGGVKSEGK